VRLVAGPFLVARWLGLERVGDVSAVMMPGGPVADAVFADLQPRIEKLKANGHTPGLATVLVGNDDASARYVGMKMEKAEELGCASPHIHLPDDAATEDVVAAVRALNVDDAVDAMLVQHPAPPQVDFDVVLMAVDPDKDVDGMHPTNLGRMALGSPGPVSCTPAGIEALLAHYEIPVSGRNVVILGRGVTIGRPLALLLSQKRPTANAAVTVVHTGVPDWPRYTKAADIVVAAAGVPGIIQPEHITPGSVVVGAGVRYEGRTLLPDVDERCEEVAGYITPRVGGVGPTTIAMLFRNFVEAAERRRS
jgi:methylenetetrahydrofolate dehydrogenase (NADP+)/methenyltetrahydrofolate cyclohydrolase